MSPRTGRPTDDRKGIRFELLLSETDMEKLEYCAKANGLTKAQVIRHSIDMVYTLTKKEAQNK